MTENALFYFFSALAQSMAALFAVVGMFAVYRLQIQENIIKEVFLKILDTANHIEYNRTMPSKLDSITTLIKRKDIIKRLEELKTNVNANLQMAINTSGMETIVEREQKIIKQIQDCLDEISDSYGSLTKIKRKMKLPLYLVAIIFCSAIAFLPTAKVLSNHNASAVILVGIFILSTLISIWKTLEYIVFTVGLTRK
ncbi:MAG: hypothetical protein HQ570_03225 [Candidatus Omnitrophica bacterium]|nr:hypothetical protein [Candidatus Omnitrophota bacterium]